MIRSVRDLIIFHEGFTQTAKPDEKGFWVIGHGHDIPAPADPKNPPSCTRQEADDWLTIDLKIAVARAMACIGVSHWTVLNDVRKAVLEDMAYELGGSGLAEFQRMLAAIRTANWQEAKNEALQSKWAEQVPGRAERDALMLLTGNWPTG